MVVPRLSAGLPISNIKNGVKAGFSYTSPAGCHAPTTVNFTNETVGTGTVNYKWDFGNGKTSTDKNPVNTYQNSGVYTVKLIASNSLGCSDTLIKSNAINIGFVKADFIKPDNVCPGGRFFADKHVQSFYFRQLNMDFW